MRQKFLLLVVLIHLFMKVISLSMLFHSYMVIYHKRFLMPFLEEITMCAVVALEKGQYFFKDRRCNQ